MSRIVSLSIREYFNSVNDLSYSITYGRRKGGTGCTCHSNNFARSKLSMLNMYSHQEVIISVRVNVTPALYACQLSYDSSVLVLRKVVILWFAIAFFLNRCHGEGQDSLRRMRGILLLNMSVGELVDRHVGRYVSKSVSPKTAINNWRTRLKPIGFKFRTLITIRRWSLSLGRLVGHVKTILDFVVDGRVDYC